MLYNLPENEKTLENNFEALNTLAKGFCAKDIFNFPVNSTIIASLINTVRNLHGMLKKIKDIDSNELAAITPESFQETRANFNKSIEEVNNTFPETVNDTAKLITAQIKENFESSITEFLRLKAVLADLCAFGRPLTV